MANYGYREINRAFFIYLCALLVRRFVGGAFLGCCYIYILQCIFRFIFRDSRIWFCRQSFVIYFYRSGIGLCAMYCNFVTGIVETNIKESSKNEC